MPKRNTKRIGDLSELMVMAALARNGYLVSVPLGENHRYDILADDGERILRVQVKTGRIRNGSIVVYCYSTHRERGYGKFIQRPYFGEIDLLAVYEPTTQKVYLLAEDQLVATAAHLRLDPTVNRQGRRIRWAADYELR